ncbi:MAG: aromatic ring-hydroxylating dioxygenase subunit alpha [Hyphomonadaceae bacterium]|nr:aromatic ring-hydroxylating dioxygenase subunit alpha [Hyphomonadaceae bacterium]
MADTTGSAAEEAVGAKGVGMAGRDTPLIRQCWYVAAFADEVTRTPMRRTILERDIVLYRKEDGVAVALQNRCAHRSYPLHSGKLSGDRIVCGYHGFEYGPDGRCAHVPALGFAPPAIRVQAYPLVEDGPFVWIWMGDPDRPDETALVRQAWCAAPGWTHVKGYMHMQANYLGLHENLMDLSHFPFLHGAALGRADHAAAKPKVRVEGDVVHTSVMHRDVAVSPAFQAATGMTAPVDRESVQSVPSPAIHLGASITTDASDPPQRHVRHIVHVPTPESQTSTHYFWAIARHTAIDDPAIDAESKALGEKAFAEDKVALEAIEDVIARDRRSDFREKIIATDHGAIQVLRAFARMAAREHDDASRAP